MAEAIGQIRQRGGMALGTDGSLYLTDGAFLRKVTMDGTVTTLARDLTVRTSEDSPRLFAGNDGSLTGLTVDWATFMWPIPEKAAC